MDELPRRMVVLGSGLVAIELAQIIHGFGVEVSLLVQNEFVKILSDV